MKNFYLLTFALLSCTTLLFAQPENDDCENPIVIPDVSGWCSEREAYTNVGATPSGYDAATCFSESSNDVWFAFVAGATDITIIVKGNTPTAAGGTLENPEVALYTANCGGVIDQLRCDSDEASNDIIESYKGGLIVGQTYLIRVQGRNGNTGSFQLCINNYNPPVDPGSDCSSSSVLCDKSPFVVQQVSGAGNDNSELNGATCFGGGIGTNFETNSTWFTWIAEKDGTLEFTLTPLKEDDDLDFVLYELPNGIDDCSGKIMRRCMASGDFDYPSPCMGPTGLREGDPDNSEPAGCNDPTQNSFLAPLNMEEGKAYALIVNNFSATGNGFSIDFGGTGTFRGPEAAFDVAFSNDSNDNIVCVNEEITFTDASAFPLGALEGWEWSFGVGAEPANAAGPGPHEISYSTPGLKSVVLTVETNLGCIVTEIGTFEVLPGLEIAETIMQPDCGGGMNGSIELELTGGQAPYAYSWNGATFVENENTLDSLAEGDYSVVVQDNQGCRSELGFELRETGLALDTTAEPFIPPSCAGDSDGSIIITATQGTSPYEYDFGNGFVSNNTLEGVSAGTYEVEVRDVNGCNEVFTIVVEDPPVLTLGVEAVNVSCTGQRDGSVTAIPQGGVAPYSYVWNNGQTTQEAINLDPGDYSVTVQDANGCERTDQASIIEPQSIFLNLEEVQDADCSGQASGSIRLGVEGGTPPFQYRVNGGVLQPSPEIVDLAAGNYIAYVEDNRGCSATLEATVGEPAPIAVEAGRDVTVNLGFDTRLQAIPNPPGKQYTYSWSPADSLSCIDCPNPSVTPSATTTYTVTVMDETGCTATDNVLVQVFKERPVYIPSAFSPNGDGKNDYFTLFSGPAARQIKTLQVFDRWGTMIFEGSDLPMNVESRGWDGTFKGENLPPGVFAYFAEVEFIDGLTLVFEGDISIIK